MTIDERNRNAQNYLDDVANRKHERIMKRLELVSAGAFMLVGAMMLTTALLVF